MRKRTLSVLSSAGINAAAFPALAALVDFAAQSSGMEWRNYYSPYDRGEALRSGRAACRADARTISKAWGELVKAVHEAALIGTTDAEIIEASRGAFSGRLTWAQVPAHVSRPRRDGKPGKIVEESQVGRWEYTAGQYFATEYRSAALAVMTAANRAHRRSLPPATRPITTIEDLKALNRENGGCWFERGEMRFFGTRIESGILPGNRFVTSEQPPHGPRMYSVRSFDAKGEIDTIGKFAEIPTRAEALAKARDLAAVQS